MSDFGKLEPLHQLSDIYAKLYNLSEHLTVDEVSVLFKGRVHSILTHHRQNPTEIINFLVYRLTNYET